jgi:hypothetical protein
VALTPGATAIFAAVSDATRQRRQLRIERYRKERAHESSMVPVNDIGVWMLYGILAMNVLAPLGIFVGAGFDALLNPKFDEYGVFLFAGLWFIASLVGGALTVLTIQRRRKAVRTAMADLARQFHGHVAHVWARVARWLDVYWAGPYPLADRQTGYHYSMLECPVHGYPALVEVNLSQSKSERMRVSVRLATTEPEVGPGSGARPEAATEAAWLTHLGFSVEESEAGLTAEATADLVKRIRQNPNLLHTLAPVLGHLSRLAFYRARAPGEQLP